jgi:hypothetical protein
MCIMDYLARTKQGIHRVGLARGPEGSGQNRKILAKPCREEARTTTGANANLFAK